MENITSQSKGSQDGISKNLLWDAYENIFNDSDHFYSLLYNQFIDINDKILVKRPKFLVRDKHLKTQTTDNFKTIIMADDDEDDRMFFKEALHEINVNTKVILLKDGTELMDHLTGNGYLLPDIIFIDLNMPKKSGMECLAELRNNNILKNLPIAIYSTSASEEEIQETYLKGANLYIKKPNDFTLIKKILKEVIPVNWDLQRRTRDTYFINP